MNIQRHSMGDALPRVTLVWIETIFVLRIGPQLGVTNLTTNFLHDTPMNILIIDEKQETQFNKSTANFRRHLLTGVYW